MPKKRHTAEQIIGLLRQDEVELAEGRTVGEICRVFGMSEATFYRWRSEYGGLKVDQARRLKDLGRENARLKRAVAELTRDKQLLKEAAEENIQAPSAARLRCGMCSRCSGFPNARRVARWASRDRRSARFGWYGPIRRH